MITLLKYRLVIADPHRVNLTVLCVVVEFQSYSLLNQEQTAAHRRRRIGRNLSNFLVFLSLFGLVLLTGTQDGEHLGLSMLSVG